MLHMSIITDYTVNQHEICICYSISSRDLECKQKVFFKMLANLCYVTCNTNEFKDTVWPKYAGRPYLKSWVLILLVLVILVVLVRESPLLAGLLLLRQEKYQNNYHYTVAHHIYHTPTVIFTAIDFLIITSIITLHLYSEIFLVTWGR